MTRSFIHLALVLLVGAGAATGCDAPIVHEPYTSGGGYGTMSSYATTTYSGYGGQGGATATGTGGGGPPPTCDAAQFEHCRSGGSCSPCAAGLTCVSSTDFEGNDGFCRPECNVDSDCPTGSLCALVTFDNPSYGVYDEYHWCTVPCTPLPDSCPTGTSCMLDGVQAPYITGHTHYVDCGYRYGKHLPSGCGGYDSLCPEGTRCVQSAGPGLDIFEPASACEPWCRMGEPADCAAGTTCVADDSPVILGGVTYGACRTRCDPLGTCAGGNTCTLQVADGVAFTDCLPPGTGLGAAGCEIEGGCGPGTMCRVHAPGEHACETVCAVGAAGGCPAGSDCVALEPAFVAYGKTYGTCEATCDPLSTATCPGSCAVVTDLPGGAASTACVQGGTSVGPAYACDTNSDYLCASEYRCMEFQRGSTPKSIVYACEKYCRVGHEEDCGLQQSCFGFVPDVAVDGVSYGVCEDACDLTTPSLVCGTDGCLPIVDGTNPPHTTCTSLATPTADGSCSSDAECPPGATCRNGRCAEWCRLDSLGHCPPGRTCTAVDPALTITGVSYGTCE